MRKKLLANIQWRAMRMTAGLSLLLCAVFITLMLLYYGLDPMLLFSSGWFGIPFVVILLLASLSAGLISGYVYGGRLKTRMDTFRPLVGELLQRCDLELDPLGHFVELICRQTDFIIAERRHPISKIAVFKFQNRFNQCIHSCFQAASVYITGNQSGRKRRQKPARR